jgi:hypothetical protein
METITAFNTPRFCAVLKRPRVRTCLPSAAEPSVRRSRVMSRVLREPAAVCGAAGGRSRIGWFVWGAPYALSPQFTLLAQFTLLSVLRRGHRIRGVLGQHGAFVGGRDE